MKLTLQIDGAEERMEVFASAPLCRFRWNGGEERSADVEAPEPGVYSILLDGRSYEARVERTPAAVIVVIDGHRFEIEIHDPRRWSRKSGGVGGIGVETLRAPMPGKVVRVLAAPGDTVAAEQGIVVVEAMKMQNEMRSAQGGRVLAVNVKDGATVAAGEVLATIESAAQATDG